ncbi:MAG: M14 family zinc carboxypeptidase [Chitinophagaceae bacterium]
MPNDNEKRTTLIGLLQIDHFMPSEEGGIISEINETGLQKLQGTPYRYTVLVPNVAKALDSVNQIYYAQEGSQQSRVAFEQPKGILDNIIVTPTAFSVKSTFGGYYSFSEMESAMNALVASYPSIASKTSIGKTSEGRDIWLIKISDNVTMDETDEPEILYQGLQHAREAITGSSMIFFMQYLCDQYGKDRRIKDLVDQREIYIIPCLNPDGWEYNRISQGGNAGGMWRKNRSAIDSTVTITQKGNNPPTRTVTYEYGVDLNRNWSVDWANCSTPILGTASSCGSGVKTSSTETYWGNNSFSEKETDAVRNFVKTHHLTAGFDQHAFGPYFSLPFGRKSLHPNQMSSKGKDFFTTIPALMGTYNGMRAADSYDALGYEVAGGFKDWMLTGELGIGNKDTVWAMTGEGAAGGGTSSDFWAPASQIINLSKGMCYQNLQLAFAAGSYVDIQDGNEIALNLNTNGLNFSVKRLGLGNDPVTITLVPIEGIQSVGLPVIISNMPIYYETRKGAINCTLNPNLKTGQRITYSWKVETSGYSFTDTITRLYNVIPLFSDDMEGSLTTNWTATSNTTDNWAFTTLNSYGGNQSLTESPAGNYTSNTVRTITNKNIFDLSNATAAYLNFWVKHRAENFRDKMQVQVSTNSTDGLNGIWTAIAGTTTIAEPGTVDGSTINGQPSLTGIRDIWTQEVFDLSSFQNSNVRFRFAFTSDGDPSSFKFGKDDGFYIDNLSVVKSMAPLSTLPIHIFNFSGKLKPDGTAALKWETSINDDLDHFEIDHSSDGIHFKKIGLNPKEKENKYLDKDAISGDNFYRIKEVNKSGNNYFTNVIKLFVPHSITISTFPNPFNNSLKVRWQNTGNNVAQLEVTDAYGRIVYSKNNVEPTINEYTIYTANWPPQVYIIKLFNKNGTVLSISKLTKL